MRRYMHIQNSLVLMLLAVSHVAVAQYAMPQVELTVGMHRIEAEVAATQEQRAVGLMRRTEMAPQHGMLFVFTQDAPHCMWMRNTLLPLSVAFLDRNGKIINIEDMQPQTENNHCAAGNARYALEMNLGWFKRRGFSVGTSIAGIEKAPFPR
ncbi:MAG: DUF192 domain-containing protein [Rhodocyclaceae bacterium]|nr:DUF192 domain-containing protein [Rhodocyclaceae bacterium]